MVINAIIGVVSTLVLFFLQAKLPLAGLNDALHGLGQLALLGQVILVGSNMIYLLEQVDEPGAGQGNGICQMIQGQTFC